MNHLSQIRLSQTSAAARKNAQKIADSLTHFREATAWPSHIRRESVPDWIDWYADPLDGYKYEKAWRGFYAGYLHKHWIDHNKRSVVQSAARIALKKVRKECGVSDQHARSLLVEQFVPGIIEY